MADTVLLNTEGAGASAPAPTQGSPDAQQGVVSVTVQDKPEDKPAEKLFAGKYKTVEEMERGYLELQKTASKAKTDTPTPESKATDATPKAEKAEDSATAKGLDVGALEKEFAKDGKLSEASYKAAEAKGLTRETVDALIETRQAQAQKIIDTVAEPFGGADQMKDALTWARTNLSQEEKDAFDLAVNSRNMTLIKTAAASLQQKYVAANGQEGALVRGEEVGGDGSSIAPIKNQQELQKVMDDPRYRNNDIEYHKTVTARLRKSQLNTW